MRGQRGSNIYYIAGKENAEEYRQRRENIFAILKEPRIYI